MARLFHEVQLMMDAAKKHKNVVTQMGNQGHSEANYFQFKAWKEANGKLEEKFDVIFCSFALHLAEDSLLPNILYNLSQISNNLVILTPHKKPDIKLYYELDLELYHEKIRLRKYKKIN